MRILGIDPGFERLGLAILEKNEGEKKERVIFSECFKTDSGLAFPDRLSLIGGEVRKIINKYEPKIMAVETLFFASNQKTAMRVAETRGVVIYEGILAGLSILDISPLQIKMSTAGYGKADKKQVAKMVKLLVGVAESKTSDDELDAIAVALTAFSHINNSRDSKKNPK